MGYAVLAAPLGSLFWRPFFLEEVKVVHCGLSPENPAITAILGSRCSSDLVMHLVVIKHDYVLRISVVVDGVRLILCVEKVTVIFSVTISKRFMGSTPARDARIVRVVLFSVAELLVDVRLLDPRPIRRKRRLRSGSGPPEVTQSRLHL